MPCQEFDLCHTDGGQIAKVQQNNSEQIDILLGLFCLKLTIL